ncbi:DUF3576 domain-containing protein [Candidatus Pelagibacter sp. HIMB1517]|uniref:DUF3576 domain-containing protein n=1 Tax=Candidatus Pelagibacter sp. HIMB1517 TaxID=3413341 RepID=UPI003F85A413
MKKINKILSYLLIAFIAANTLSCSYFDKNKDKNKEENSEQSVLKKKKRDHNLKKRAEEYDGGIIFGKKGILRGGDGGVAQFAAENVLWRAAMQTVDFVPLATANYSGGIIITDWYSNEKSNESIKIQVSFTSNELKASSFQIKSFKRSCADTAQSCKIVNLDGNFNRKIKNQILETAKNIKIKLEQTKK